MKKAVDNDGDEDATVSIPLYYYKIIQNLTALNWCHPFHTH